MDAEAVKECLEDLIAVHDRAPYDLKIDHMMQMADTYYLYDRTMSAIINYLGDPYGAIIDMDMEFREKAVCQCGRNRPIYCRECYSNPDRSGQK